MKAMRIKKLNVFFLFLISLCLLPLEPAIGQEKENAGKPKIVVDEFVQAARNGNIVKVEELLLSGVNPEILDGRGKRALGEAVFHPNIVQLLLDNGASLEGKDAKGKTALLYAVFENQVKTIEVLLEKGASPNFITDHGYPIIMVAWRFEAIEFLLKKGADVNSRNSKGETALLNKARSGRGKIVELLLKNGADPNIPDQTGNSPLHYSARANYPDVMDLLIRYGARIDPKNKKGKTPLLLALDFYYDILDFPFKRRDNKKVTNTPTALVNYGADVNSVDQKGISPAMAASILPSPEVLKAILKKGGSVHLKDNQGLTALMWAASVNQDANVSLLLNNRADPEVKDRNGRTAIFYAAAGGLAESIKVLVQNGSSVNPKDVFGRKPLDWTKNKLAREILENAGAVSSEEDQPIQPEMRDARISLSRFPCFGSCPEYWVALSGDGYIVYKGIGSVQTKGIRFGLLNSAETKEIFEKIQNSDIWSFGEKYEEQSVTDASSASLYFTYQGKKKRISHYHGDKTSPSELSELEDEIDRFLDTKRWTGVER